MDPFLYQSEFTRAGEFGANQNNTRRKVAEEEEVLDFIAGLSSPSPAGNTSNRRLSHHERESGGEAHKQVEFLSHSSGGGKEREKRRGDFLTSQRENLSPISYGQVSSLSKPRNHSSPSPDI